MATKIFPSLNDVGVSAGDGNICSEDNLSAWRGEHLNTIYRNGELFGAGGVVSGFDYNTGTATSLTLNAGVAIIRGFRVETTSTITGTLTASTYNYVFLALTKSGGLVTGVELAVRTAATYDTALASIPDDSILLGVFQTDGSTITNQFDFRTPPSNCMVGFYIGDDAATRTIDIGFRPKQVMLQRTSTPQFIAWSHVPYVRAGTPKIGMYATSMVDDGGCGVALSTGRDTRPQLEENGFSVEDGPGTIAPGAIMRSVETSYDPPTINNATIATKTIAVGGARVGDTAIASHADIALRMLTMDAIVTSSGIVTCYIKNQSGASINPAAADLIVTVIGQGGTGAGHKLNELNVPYYFIAWY